MLELRLDQELGDVCERAGDERCLREQDVASRRDFQVLARLTRLDLPEGYVEVRPPRADVRVRLGRQILADAAGFLRLDGGRATASAHPLVSVDVFGGLYAQETSFAGSDGYALQGNLRFELPDALADERAPLRRLARRARWVIGGTASVGDARVVKVDAIAREARDEGGDLAARRVGRRRAKPPASSALGLRAHGLWDPTDGTLVDAVAEIEGLTPRGLVRASARRVEPRFDLGSVWAFFDVVPTDQLSLGGSCASDVPRWPARCMGALDAAGRDRLRRGRRDVCRPARRRPIRRARRPALGGQRRQHGTRVRGSRPRRAAPSTCTRVPPSGISITRGSSVFTATASRPQRRASALLTEQVRLRGELEWMHNRVAGHRVRALASLTLRVWR
ncbi:MAG: hypothetical protein H6723_13490 [Sandaracinus sp.]|nr:hypothetical protein [Sandaracinus sp.]